MEQKKTLRLFLNTILIMSLFVSSPSPLGASSEKQYLASLHDASDKVRMKKQKNSLSQALSTSLILKLLGRYYQIGDRWRVLSWIYQHSLLPKLQPSQAESPSFSAGGLFEYEVRDIKPGLKPEITVSITQIAHPELPPVDPQVKELLITLDDQLMEQKKLYVLTHPNHTLSIPSGGVGPSLSPLGLYPLELPDVLSAEENQKPPLPELPPPLQKWANRFSWKMNRARTTAFQQDDFFGRPIEFFWEKGQPWPSYLKTPRGISLLIESGVGHEL